MRLAIISGTRPERIKLASLLAWFRARGTFGVLDVHTGQHTQLVDGLGGPDVDLGLQTTGDRWDDMDYFQQHIAAWLDQAKADVVLVQGDTLSAWAGAMAAAQLGVPVIHLEAGVRSHDEANPNPEEGYRVDIGMVAGLHLCPTAIQAQNLSDESVGGTIVVVGNTVVDGMDGIQRMVPGHGLITLHRHELLESDRFPLTARAMAELSWQVDYPILWPMHPNPVIRRVFREATLDDHRLILLPPVHRDSFLGLLASARWVITDSGGVQEEAAVLGIRGIIARQVTDRPETVQAGSSWLLGKNEPALLRHLAIASTREMPPIPYRGYHHPEGETVAEVAGSVIEQWLRDEEILTSPSAPDGTCSA